MSQPKIQNSIKDRLSITHGEPVKRDELASFQILQLGKNKEKNYPRQLEKIKEKNYHTERGRGREGGRAYYNWGKLKKRIIRERERVLELGKIKEKNNERERESSNMKYG